MRIRKFFFTPLFLLVFAVSAFAQQPFNKAEFAARRAKLFEKISDGIAVVFAAKGQHYPVKFRQSPDFYYQLQDVADVVYKKYGFGKEFQALGRYIGHTIGLSVHDVQPADRNRPLEAGVVFNVEPLLELPEKKIHMRLEDTVLVTPTGALNMTANAPAALEEIYALIRQSALSLRQ